MPQNHTLPCSFDFCYINMYISPICFLLSCYHKLDIYLFARCNFFLVNVKSIKEFLYPKPQTVYPV